MSLTLLVMKNANKVQNQNCTKDVKHRRDNQRKICVKCEKYLKDCHYNVKSFHMVKFYHKIG